MNKPKKKQKTEFHWEGKEFSTREVRKYSHTKRLTRKDDGFPVTEKHVSVTWLKKAVEKFHVPGTTVYKEHYMDLKLTALKLYDEICGAFRDFERPSKPLDGLNFVDVILNHSKVIEETTLMRSHVESDVKTHKEGIEQKYKGHGNYDCARPRACVSHDDKDAEAARKEAVIRSNGDERTIEKKLAAYRFKTKRTNAKRRLSAVQKFVNKKGDLVSDVAIEMVVKLCDVDQVERLEWKKELHSREKISWIFDHVIVSPMNAIKQLQINTVIGKAGDYTT